MMAVGGAEMRQSSSPVKIPNIPTTVQIGQINCHGQMLLQRTGRQSETNAAANVWILRCQHGHTYEANSCDFDAHKCPHCLKDKRS